MSADLPEPLVPAYVDLRGLDFQPLHVNRLLKSDLFALSSGNEFKAACALWCQSWDQVPGGSLPDNDKTLAHLCGVQTVQVFRRLKPMALRGWQLCSDGRLYHPLIAADALAAWARRDEWKAANKAKDDRQSRWRARCKALAELLRARGVTIPKAAGMAELLALAEVNLPGFNAAKWQAATQAQAPTPAPPPPASVFGVPRETKPYSAPPAEPPAAAPATTPQGSICRAMRQAGVQSVNPGDPRLLALIEQGATLAEFEGLAAEAVEKQKGWAWILYVLEARRREAAQIRLVAPAAATAPDPRAWTSNRAEVIVRGINLGVGPWDQTAHALGRGETWDQYLQRVIEADQQRGGAAA
jgi:hypothetical protein